MIRVEQIHDHTRQGRQQSTSNTHSHCPLKDLPLELLEFSSIKSKYCNLLLLHLLSFIFRERTRDAQIVIISLRNMFKLADRLDGIFKTGM